MSSKFRTKRDSLEIFLKEQIIGPGGFNKRFFLLDKWASNEFAGKELKDCEAIDNVSEVISEVPAYQYSSAILFPISVDANPETGKNGEEEDDQEDELAEETKADVEDDEVSIESKADDEKFQDDHTESVSSKNQNYPNTCGIAFAVIGNSNLENDLNVKLRLRTYQKLSQAESEQQKLGYSIKANNENISRIIKQYFNDIFTIEDRDNNLFVCLRNGVDINIHLYSLDYVNLENFLKTEIKPKLDEILPGEKFYKLTTKTYDGVTYQFHNMYEGSLTDEIAKKLREDRSLYTTYGDLIGLIELYFQIKEIVTELKTIYRKNSKRNIPTQIWESIPFVDEFKLPPFISKENVLRGEFSIKGLDNLSISYQYLRYRTKDSDFETIYIKLILVNRNEIQLKPNEPPQLNKKNKANRKSFFGINLSVSEIKVGILLPYNPPNLLYIDQESSFTKLLYRRYKDYGEGYNTSVNWGTAGDSLKYVSTEFIPEQEIPKVDFKRSKFESGKILSRIKDNVLLMHRLSTLSNISNVEIISDLNNFVNEYGNWINEKRSELTLSNIIDGKDLLERQLQSCLLDFNRLKRIILLLADDSSAMTAFRLMNTAMFMQLHHGISVKKAIKDGGVFLPSNNSEEYYSKLDAPYKWRSFQIAFILLNIDGFVRPSPDQQIVEDVFETGWPERNELADLVWFPTGGGKTEAYLGIIAFAVAYRRFTQGARGFGTTVLMRYTLRLLTLQQFQRATLLICAMEVIRKEEFSIPFKLSLGKERITIGLFVGGDSTPNWWSNHKNSMSDELIRIQDLLEDNRQVVTKLPHTECPWCGGKLFVDKELKNIFPSPSSDSYGIKQKLIISCNTLDCTFHDPWLTNEDMTLPLALFDEDIYKFPPTLLFGTVDKFAALANKVSITAGERNQDSRRLFGKGSHIDYLPPELIIQDELHLLLGPLGSAVGLFERAIDELCSYKNNEGKITRPKIITSTATTRNTDKQIFALFNRRSEIFPKQGIDCDDSFFAYYERDEKSPHEYISNRKYIGLLPIGKTQVWMQLRVASICLTHRLKFMNGNLSLADIFSNSSVYHDLKKVLDYYHTVLSYFNSLKEVGKTQSQLSHYLPGDINLITKNSCQWTFLDKLLRDRESVNNSELTGRLSGEEVKTNLSKIESSWELQKRNGPPEFVISTNMISVGIDVSRFNTMIINSMPRNTAEYIQASSRVAREVEGIVFTVHHPFRSRDISHYQRFKEFHEKFYGYVEPISVTPYAMKALERYLAMYLAVVVRHNSALNLSNNGTAVNIDQQLFETVRGTVIEQIKQVKRNCDLLNKHLKERKEGINLNIDGIIGDEEINDFVDKLDDLLSNRWLDRKADMDPPIELSYRSKNSINSLFNPSEGASLHDNWNVKQSLREIAPSVVIKTVQQ